MQTGVAFLPMVGALVVASTTVSTRLAARISPRILLPAGLLLCAAGMWILTGLSTHTTYVTHTLPATMILGLGLGTVFSRAMSMATLGVEPGDAGVGSATINTMQQVGGSVGTALLNTLAATAASTYAAAHRAEPAVQKLAAVHGYTVAFWWAAGIFSVGAILVATILCSRVSDLAGSSQGPVGL